MEKHRVQVPDNLRKEVRKGFLRELISKLRPEIRKEMESRDRA